MTFQEIKESKFSGDVVIIGHAGTGKTTLSEELALRNPTHKVFHADHYMRNGYELGMYELMEDIKKHDGPKIIEGVNCFRLLRKGAQTGTFYPQTVIEMNAPEGTRERMYRQERKERDWKYLKAQDAGNNTIYKEYLQMRNPQPPAFYRVDNDY